MQTVPKLCEVKELEDQYRPHTIFSLRINGPQLWNSIGNKISELSSLGSLNYAHKSYLIDHRRPAYHVVFHVIYTLYNF